MKSFSPKRRSFIPTDYDPEHVQNGITMTVEGTARNWQPLTHIRIKPMPVNLIEGKFLVLVNGIHKPDVLLEKGV